MLDFFSSLMEYIELLWSLVLGFVDGLMTLWVLLNTSSALPAMLSYLMPSVLTSCVLAVIAISLVKLVVGR